MSVDPHNELHTIQDHYIGIDVGTGSARACIMNDKGDIVGLAIENIGLWQPETGYYVSLPWSSYTGLYSHPSRNNPRQTSGDASATRSSVP